MDLFQKFNVLAVLEDGDTFSGAKNATIRVYPRDENCTVGQLEYLREGLLPETGDLEIINLDNLLKEALEANLPCVQDLAKRLKS